MMKKVKIVQSYLDLIELGREGMADFSTVEKTGNVMFYPKEGQNPYRICLPVEYVKVID